HPLARAFEGGGGRLAEGVHATVDIGMLVALVMLHRAQHRKRALRGGGAVEIGERPSMHGRGENRKIAAHRLDIERPGCSRNRDGGSHQSSSRSVSSRN